LCELIAETRRIVVEVVEAVPSGLAVPLKVDVKTGPNCAEYK
jgi:DNA polymerase I-like protein with 3'-5' exonuclease and polymerase domains